jgi:hypothetical protein
MKELFLLLALASGCAYFEHHKEKDGPPAPGADLGALYQEHLAQLAAASDPATGWPSATDCDGTLWAGLACAAGAPVDVAQAEYAPGVLHRRPASVGACWTPEDGDVGSKSTVSQDMATGYVWCLWRRGDRAALARLADYGEAHAETLAGQPLGWVLGEPYPQEAARVVLRPNLIGVIGRALESLSAGTDQRSYRTLPALYPPVEDGYQRHLQVLGILLQGETANHNPSLFLDIDGDMLRRLHEAADAHPEDALYQAALAVYTGDYAAPTARLVDPAYQPPDYVRGAPAYGLVHWLFAAKTVLNHTGGLAHASAQ